MKEFYLAINTCPFAKQQHTHVRAIISFFLCLSTNKTFTGFDIDYAGIIIISIYLSPRIYKGVAAAYVRKSGKQAGKFSRKIRNCKTCSHVAFHGQICMNVNQQL